MEHVSGVEQDNADTSRHAQLLEEKVTITNWVRKLLPYVPYRVPLLLR